MLEEDKKDENIDKERVRRVPAMDIILSKDFLDINEPGYQEPLTKDEIIL